MLLSWRVAIIALPHSTRTTEAIWLRAVRAVRIARGSRESGRWLAGTHPKILTGRVFYTQSGFHFGPKRATIHRNERQKRGFGHPRARAVCAIKPSHWLGA